MEYAYEPLPQSYHTRVLELHPALDPNSALRGNFRNVNLDGDPFYDAISYTWGAPDFTEEVFIGEEFRMPITENLRDALIRFRHPTEIRSIWADAICIDQKNDEEKSKQIPSMKDIYRCASSVLVWLGKLPVADACLREISLLSQRKMTPTTASHMEKISSALNRLVSIPWFSRRWVIQEIVTNPCVTFFSRTNSVSWLRTLQLLRLVPKEQSSPPILHLHSLREVWETYNPINPPDSKERESETTSILRLLSLFDGTDCADARDRIYALVGVASDVVFDNTEAQGTGGKIPICIDYTQNVDQVYKDFAMAVVNAGRSSSYVRLLIETNRRSNDSHTEEWTSWVPDWRLPILRFEIGANDMLPLGGEFFSDCSRDFKIPRTQFTGEIVDTISAPYPTDADKPTKLAWLRSIFTSINERHTAYQTHLPMNPKQTAYLWRILGSLFTLWPQIDFGCSGFNPHGDEPAVFNTVETNNVRNMLENYSLFTIGH
ncbi:heterokaryon incompatibility protein-domain-containing protein [Nemania sp. NC0429]|nr:heterokaryon incompatibility protein-domain-containing protein [Nemania sp. NC0429]